MADVREGGSGRGLQAAVVVLAAGIVVGLALWLGVEETLDLLRTGLIGLLYVAIPVALVGGLVGLFFRLSG